MTRKLSEIAVLVILFCSVFIACNAAGNFQLAVRRGRGRGSGAGGGVGGGKMFNVLSFGGVSGAKPGIEMKNSMAFIQAWKAACNFNGPSTLVIPPGLFKLSEVVFEGPCQSRPITFLIQGTLQAVTDDASAFSGKGWISFEHMTGLIITGRGTIDAQGQNLWPYNDCKKNSNCVHLPASIYMVGVTDAKIMWINLVNSMGFHMHVTRCNQIRVKGVHITAPGDSPNTDGLHVSSSNMVRISRSVISTGDDCISVGQGATNVNVNKITCGPGHGISIGSLGKIPSETPVQGVIVQNCTLTGTTNGIRIKTYAGSGPMRASGMLFKDIIMNNVQNPIIIDQNYGSKSAKPSQVKISDVVYQNIRGTTTTPIAVNLACSSQVPCQNVHLLNINLRANGVVRPTSTCANAQVGYMGVQFPPPCRH